MKGYIYISTVLEEGCGDVDTWSGSRKGLRTFFFMRLNERMTKTL